MLTVVGGAIAVKTMVNLAFYIAGFSAIASGINRMKGEPAQVYTIAEFMSGKHRR
jgi:hypothetical protein